MIRLTKFCDRCKKEYNENDLGESAIVQINFLEAESCLKDREKKYDLCQECSSEFKIELNAFIERCPNDTNDNSLDELNKGGNRPRHSGPIQPIEFPRYLSHSNNEDNPDL